MTLTPLPEQLSWLAMSPERNPNRSSSLLNSSVDPTLSMWTWLIRFLTSDRDVPFSALVDIINNIPYTLDDFPRYISEGLALRCLEERTEAAKDTSTSASAEKIDATQYCEKVLFSKLAAENEHIMENHTLFGEDLLQFILLKREIMQKNSESSQPNVTCFKGRNNLPEVSRTCAKRFTYNSHRDDHGIGKFNPTMKYASPRRKCLNLIRKYREMKNLANMPFKGVGEASQNDFNILQNSSKQNSLDDIQNQKTADDSFGINNEEVSAEFHEVNLTGLHSPIIASDNSKESLSGQDSKNQNVLLHDRQELQGDNAIQNLKASNIRLTVENNQKIGITDHYCLSSHTSHERNDEVCVDNGTCEVSKNHLQAEDRKNPLTSDADDKQASLHLNENSVLNIEGVCDHSANRKALSSKISVRFAKQNRKEKANRDDNHHGVIENKKTDRSSLKELKIKRDQQTHCIAIKTPSRRPKLIWKPEEEEVLEKAMKNIPQNEDGSTSWIKILEYCRPILHESRTPIDLKDKWRNIQIREAKNRGKKPLLPLS